MVSALNTRLLSLQQNRSNTTDSLSSYGNSSSSSVETDSMSGQSNGNRVSGYSADREGSISPTSSLSILPRHSKITASSDRKTKRKRAENDYAAFSARSDLLKAGRSVSDKVRSRKITPGSIDMSRTQHLSSTQVLTPFLCPTTAKSSFGDYARIVRATSGFYKQFYDTPSGNEAISLAPEINIVDVKSGSTVISFDEEDADTADSDTAVITIEEALEFKDRPRLLVRGVAPFHVMHSNACFTRLIGSESKSFIGLPLATLMSCDKSLSRRFLLSNETDDTPVRISSFNEGTNIEDHKSSKDTMQCHIKVSRIHHEREELGHLCIDLAVCAFSNLPSQREVANNKSDTSPLSSSDHRTKRMKLGGNGGLSVMG
uniref:Uncharacterized protein n=1 Tax=Attheya septentrionalis TaxID=420275 RepID=A0A7S2U6X9_9STRA|mmetsp:Transcript_10947/g.20000  ORF Transcript_10947/g.20000 Transcript_10947/m.20000 type:complete len:373 (+) Transcript_10947:203-1321(+)